jgi:hypothetical protein
LRTFLRIIQTVYRNREGVTGDINIKSMVGGNLWSIILMTTYAWWAVFMGFKILSHPQSNVLSQMEQDHNEGQSRFLNPPRFVKHDIDGIRPCSFVIHFASFTTIYQVCACTWRTWVQTQHRLLNYRYTASPLATLYCTVGSGNLTTGISSHSKIFVSYKIQLEYLTSSNFQSIFT